MAIIKEVIYKYQGKDFKSLEQLKKQVENDLGKIIDDIDVSLTPLLKLKIFEQITACQRGIENYYYSIERIKELEKEE